MIRKNSIYEKKREKGKLFKSGFIAIVGAPNVGKSTLLNYVIGQKISIVSNKPQTTRNKILGVCTDKDSQMVFLDTPGIHKPKTKLGETMIQSVVDSLDGVDLVLFLVEPNKSGNHEMELLKKVKKPIILVINKVDTIRQSELLECIQNYEKEEIFSEIVPISALTGKNVDTLKKVMMGYLPEGPKYYDEETVTEETERQIVSEMIREKALLYLQEEIPHGIAVWIDSMKEENKIMRISATIYCERESHKGMIIGKSGAMLKKIGSAARGDIEKMLDQKVFLELWVKVREKWRDDSKELKKLGFDRS